MCVCVSHYLRRCYFLTAILNYDACRLVTTASSNIVYIEYNNYRMHSLCLNVVLYVLATDKQIENYTLID